MYLLSIAIDRDFLDWVSIAKEVVMDEIGIIWAFILDYSFDQSIASLA